MIDKYGDLIMNWMVGLPITLGSKCHPYCRPILLLVSLIWIPVMFVICLPLMIPWMIAETIIGLWDCMKHEN